MNGLLPLPPLLSVSPCLQRAMFLSSPTRSSLFLPSSESSFATCHVSELTNPLLPLPPLQQVSPLFAMCHVSELTNPLLPLSPLQQVGWLIRYPHGRPQRAQCALVHWYVAPSTHPSIHPHRNLLSPGQLESTTLHARHTMQIDKYSQIYRILLPICNTLSQLPVRYKLPTLCAYIDAECGSLDALYLEILGDFFRHAFDGSGADNFYDAGSCIDGRLTSAWNWCVSLEKKRYFHVHTILFLELLRIQESAGWSLWIHVGCSGLPGSSNKHWILLVAW